MTETLLVVSFSTLTQDARLRREIALFADRYDVVTAGYGPAVDGAVRHHEIPVPPTSGRRRKVRFYTEGVLLRLRAYRLLYATDPTVRAAKKALRGERIDRVLANDLETVPLALDIAPAASVHADLHEFYPGLHDDNPTWVRLRKPYFEWLLRTSAARAASVTTVGEGVAGAYRAMGIHPKVVTNSPAYAPRIPGLAASPIRIVHAGGAMPGRRIEAMMRAAATTRADVLFTLHLTPNDPAYLARLHALADELGDRIRIEPPVPQAELLDVLAAHDVGIHVLPPTVTNQALALPNKFFDFVQARLGIIVGPTEGMAQLLRAHGLGAVTEGFDEDAIRATLDALDVDTVNGWKSASDAAAPALSAESQLPVWVEAVDALAPRRP